MLFFVPEVLPANRYYLTVLLPGAAALTGLALGSLSTRATPDSARDAPHIRSGRSSLCYSAVRRNDRAPYDLGVLLRNLSAKSELLITETGGSPNVLYYADRRGWMVSGLYSPEMARSVGPSWRTILCQRVLGSFLKGKHSFAESTMPNG